jgi:predicted exporter
MSRDQRTLLAGALAFAALIAFVVTRFEVTNDVAEFLPESGDRELGALSRQIADGELSRMMVLVVDGPDEATVTAASAAFEAALHDEPDVERRLAFLEGGPPDGVDRALWELYEPRRLGFLAGSAEAAQARLSDEALAEAAADLRAELAGPMSPLLARVAPRDPLLVLPTLFERLGRSQANDLAVADGRFVTRDGRAAVLFLATRASAFDAAAQAPFLEGVERAFAGVDARFGGALSLDQSGVNRFATRAAAAIRDDIQRVSIFSAVFIVGLLLLLFRGLRVLLLASLSVGAGVVAGAAVVLFAFGRLHAITVAFGASLIGVTIDYVIHLYCHHAVLAPPGGPRATLASIVRPLATGASTTMAGFLALLGSSLGGLREVACFAATGIVVAFFVTCVILPPLMPEVVPQTRALMRFIALLERVLAFLRAHRRRLWIPPALALAFIAVYLPRAHFEEDIASLGKLDPGLLAEDARVRARVTRFEQMRFVVALGGSEAEALSANERVARALDEAVSAEELGGYRSLAALLPSPTTQAEVTDAVRGDPTLPARVEAAFTAAGFAEGAFEPFFETLRGPAPEPLTYDALLASPLASWVRPFRISLGDRVGVVTFLHGVADADALEARLAGEEGVVFLRQSDLFGRANRLYQQSTLELLGAGLLAVLVLLLLRYREPRRALAVFVPATIAAAFTVSVLTFAGRGLDLVTITALLFVVSMGEDYGVFLVDANDETDARHLAAALASVVLACVTTVMDFALLAPSDHPVLGALGITASAGIAACLLLAPTTLFLLRPERSRPELDHEGAR